MNFSGISMRVPTEKPVSYTHLVAVDKNDGAPIFDVADLGVVCDVTSLLPKLTEAIKQYKDCLLYTSRCV